MAETQGCAGVWERKGVVLATTSAIISGGQLDDGYLEDGNVASEPALFASRVGGSGSATEVGAGLREALRQCRYVDDWDWDRWRDVQRFNRELAEAFGLRSSRSLYPGMKAVSVVWRGERVVLTPTRRRHGGLFVGFAPVYLRDHEDVELSFSASDAELGEAVRECLRRCL